MKRSKSYCIQGIPQYNRDGHRDREKEYQYIFRRTTLELMLERQHEEEPLFARPIHLDVQFYMPIPVLDRFKPDTMYHGRLPTMLKLLQYIIETLKNRVIADQRLIASISCTKVFDAHERTELTIREL